MREECICEAGERRARARDGDGNALMRLHLLGAGIPLLLAGALNKSATPHACVCLLNEPTKHCHYSPFHVPHTHVTNHISHRTSLSVLRSVQGRLAHQGGGPTVRPAAITCTHTYTHIDIHAETHTRRHKNKRHTDTQTRTSDFQAHVEHTTSRPTRA